jgi:photosystem II stability/assembly factor-like uncharacterized protein
MRFALALALAGAVAVVATAAYGRGAAHGVPHGFRPEAGAAVGERDLWVLGEYRCGSTSCDALVRSTDAGRRFTRVGWPSFPAQGSAPKLQFANARDGFAYVEGGTPLYVTHDGGHTWRREGPNRHVAAFASAGGYAYLLAGRHRIERSPVGRTSWRRLPLIVSHRPFSLAARGSNVWFLGPPRRRPDFDTVAVSSDGGRTFATRKGPCLAELGGALVAAGGGVVWAVCPTGNMGELLLSTDGGRSFPAVRSVHDPGGLREPSLVNSAELAAASPRVAVLSRGANGALLRTTDTGRHWRTVPGTGGIEQVFWLGFTTRRVGTAVVQTRSGAELWRTTDGGATWHSVALR